MRCGRDPAIDVEIWGDELHRLREVLRALEVVSPFEAGYFVATRRELTDALEFAVALDEKLLYGGRIAEPLELVRLKYLARELAVIHQEETGGSSGKAAQMEAWEPIEPRDCDAVADRVSRGGRLLALHGSLPPSWVEAIPGEVCARDGCHHRERLATLLARDSTLHTEALKQILENSPCRRRLQTPILQGLRFGYAPVEHRLAFLGAWIAQVDLQDEDQREYLEWNRSFLLTEQEFLMQH